MTEAMVETICTTAQVLGVFAFVAFVLGVIIAPFTAVAFPFLFAAFVWNEVDRKGEA